VRVGLGACGENISTVAAPLAGDTGRTRSYTSWWKSDLVVQGPDEAWHTRRFLVAQVANTEAVHFDLFADVDYEALRTEPHGWSGAVDGQELHVAGDIVTASIRQIAWEVDATLDAQCGTLLGAE